VEKEWRETRREILTVTVPAFLSESGTLTRRAVCSQHRTVSFVIV